jgi:hypothetical protein
MRLECSGDFVSSGSRSSWWHSSRAEKAQRAESKRAEEGMHKLGGGGGGGGDKSTVKIKFDVTFKGVSGLGPPDGGSSSREVFVAWKRGSKKGNRGETKHAALTSTGPKGSASAQWNETFSLQATMLHYERLKKFDKKMIDVTLKEVLHPPSTHLTPHPPSPSTSQAAALRAPFGGN